uniref:Uncharacterized protein n=1 Tax=Arundo donax TaxID=35708 RepID=A0A0A9BHK9_ARUDO
MSNFVLMYNLLLTNLVDHTPLVFVQLEPLDMHWLIQYCLLQLVVKS